MIYKETQHPTKLDPNLTEWTGTWRDSRDINPVGGQPENELIGQLFTMNAWRNDPLQVPRRFATMRWWRNTAVEQMASPSSNNNANSNKNNKQEYVAYLRGLLGHEMDEDVDNGFRPPSTIHLSETHVENTMYIQDYGATYDSGHGIHRLTLYKHNNSGAIVFGAGTCQWSWGLSGFHDGETNLLPVVMNKLNTRVGVDIFAPVRDIVQFTVTLLNEMAGAKPVAEILAAEQFRNHDGSPAAPVKVLDETEMPKDTVAPSCRIQTVHLHLEGKVMFPDSPQGEPEDAIRITAMAKDFGGGVVAGLEIFLDRWYYALPVSTEVYPKSGGSGEGDDASEETAWSVLAPLRGEALELLQANRVTDLLELAYCRATDDSLNTGQPFRLLGSFKKGDGKSDKAENTDL